MLKYSFTNCESIFQFKISPLDGYQIKNCNKIFKSATWWLIHSNKVNYCFFSLQTPISQIMMKSLWTLEKSNLKFQLCHQGQLQKLINDTLPEFIDFIVLTILNFLIQKHVRYCHLFFKKHINLKSKSKINKCPLNFALPKKFRRVPIEF